MRTARGAYTEGVDLHKLTYAMDREGPIVWPDAYRREPTTGPDRLVIAPSTAPLDVMCELAEAIGPEYFALYVHQIGLDDLPTGRFESPALELGDVRELISEFGELLENDARHQFWIGATSNDGLLVYDEHGLIYAYGPLADFTESLQSRGLRPGEFRIPVPHAHHYHQKYTDDVRRLIAYWNWRHLELQPEDER